MRDLIERYGQLRADPSAQHRGRLFNELLADLLRADGLDAEAGVRGVAGRDEVDVAFEHDKQHHILEAKWLKDPVNVEPVVVLADRLDSRPAGTRGVFVSMSGYTAAVLGKAAAPRWKQIIFLDRDHIEAMLSGLLTPGALLSLIHQHTARHGGSYISLEDLLLHRHEMPQIAVVQRPGGHEIPSLHEAAVGKALDIKAPGCGRMTGLAIAPHGELLVTTEQGVLRIDPTANQCAWMLALPECRGRVFPRQDGSILVVCHNAAVHWHRGRLTVVGGGFDGERIHLLPGPEGQPWVFNGPRQGVLVRLGDCLGDEQRHPVYVQSAALDAVWLHGTTFFLSGNGSMAVIDLHEPSGGREAWRSSPVPFLYAAARLSACGVAVAEGGRTTASVPIVRLDPVAGTHEPIAELQGHGVIDIAMSPDGSLWVLMGAAQGERYEATAIQLTVSRGWD